MAFISSILEREYGGYQSWAIVRGRFDDGGSILRDSDRYHLHPAMPASEKAAEALGCEVGTKIAGIRWIDSE